MQNKAQQGIELKITQGGATFCAGITEKSIDYKRDAVDIGCDEDNGCETFATFSGLRSVSIPVSAVIKNAKMRELIMLQNPIIPNLRVVYPDASTLTANFLLEGLKEEYKGLEASKCSFTLKTSGSWIYSAPVINKKIVVLGSSVASGTGSTGGTNGWAQRLSAALTNGYTLVNKSIGGDTTQLCINRFNADVSSETPGIVIIGLSLANEGLHGAANPGAIYSTFMNNMQTLLTKIQQIGAKAIIAGVYPNNLYTAGEYTVLKQADIALSKLGVPYFHFLGSVDDGSGHWQTGTFADEGHPNDVGAEALFRTIDLSVFDNLGTYTQITNSNYNYYKMLMPANNSLAPIIYTPINPIRSATVLFKVRRTSTAISGQPRVAFVGSSAVPLRIRNPAAAANTTTSEGIYKVSGAVSTVDTDRVTSSIDSVDHAEHWLAAVIHRETNTVDFYADGILAGSATVDAIGAITAIAFGTRPDNLSAWDVSGYEYSQLHIWRSALRAEQVVSAINGDVFMGSLVLCSPIKQPAVIAGDNLGNLAPSSTQAVLGVSPSLIYAA
ncbi:MAG TPA: phage tail tube protein [Cellvibrionaceae bacterium]